MKTVLVTTAYINEENRYKNLINFIKYYQGYEICSHLEYTDLIVLDNCSDFSKISSLMENFIYLPVVQRFTENFKRNGVYDYKYWWRAIYFFEEILKEYDKIVYLDNDFYLLTPKICEYITNLNSGWTSLYSAKYGFPESACQILLKDCEAYHNFVADGDFKKHVGKAAELIIPFTHVEKGFNGDRLGEGLPHPLQLPEHDYWAQMYSGKLLKFNIDKPRDPNV